MARTTTQERVKRLEDHLKQENPVLAGAVGSFQRLDQVARKLGLMNADDSFATQVSWWPVISVLGTFSAGKSTFLNQYVGHVLQRTGNQAVDDKFTVICYGSDDTATVLPGLALDSDPRFPFYQISRNIEKVAEGEGRRVDSYLQLKTCKAESLRGKIFIDSPGFDADQQRSSTLLITDHIIDLSDLVLVFFDARHPEPGAMGDTLKHLVANTVSRPDATKFLYILNQIDNTAREDNPEEVVAAWQRALAQHGLTAGRFYRIYAREAAIPVEDAQVRERLERKRDEDLSDI
ncbi:MAG: dynamin family protein, partial [Pseudomonadales bacterium]